MWSLQPQLQIQIDPNIEAAGLDASLFGLIVQVPPRRLYQRGARALQWQAEDRNGDTLEYAVYYRALNETNFRLLKDHIRETFYTVDGASLADGRYVFRVVASDALDNPAAIALSADRISEPVDIDNTPPSCSFGRSACKSPVIGCGPFSMSKTPPAASNVLMSASTARLAGSFSG